MLRFIFLLSIFLCANATIASYKVTSVIAIGSGLSKQEALHDAMKKAIIKAVGAYVSTKTIVYNDKLDEKIIILSDANVSNYTEIKSFKHDDIWIVKIKANILPNELIKYQPKLITQKISNTEIGNLITKENSIQNAKTILDEIFKDYCLQLYKFKKQNISMTDSCKDNVALKLNFTAYLDQIEYKKFQNKMLSVLDKIAFQKIKYRISKNAPIPKTLAENLYKKTGERVFDAEEYAFVAFKNSQKSYTDYYLYLIPRGIYNQICRNIYVGPDGLMYNRYNAYLVCSFFVTGNEETYKTFIELDKLTFFYFEKDYRGGYFPVGNWNIAPLTFTNKIKIDSRYWDRNTKIDKDGYFCFSTNGKTIIDCPQKYLKNLKEVYIYTIESTNNDKEHLLKSVKQIEEKFWHKK